MVELRSIPSGSLGSAINFAFRGDWQLIHKYHLINGDLTDCVKSTFREIDRVSQGGTPLEYFGIYYEEMLIGFTVTGPKLLFSFGINIQYRTKEIVLKWWQCVLTYLGQDFVTFLFKKNKPAVDFLMRNGMVVGDDQGEYLGLVHLKPSVCQQEDI